MGFSVSWIARAGTSTEELVRTSGRKLTGDRDDFMDVGWYLLELPSAQKPWVLLIADGSDNFLELEEKHALALSSGGNETLYFLCSDTVMATCLVCYRDAAPAWAIHYSCEAGAPMLQGEVPLLAKRQIAESAEPEDLYEVTAKLVLALVGFRHDCEPETEDEEPFQLLA